MLYRTFSNLRFRPVVLLLFSILITVGGAVYAQNTNVSNALREINYFRSLVGLQPLEPVDELNLLIQFHTDYMAAQNFDGHEVPNNIAAANCNGTDVRTYQQRVDNCLDKSQMPPTTTTSNEILAFGSPNARQAALGWISSTHGHCTAAMNPNGFWAGTGFSFAPNTQYQYYWGAVIFADQNMQSSNPSFDAAGFCGCTADSTSEANALECARQFAPAGITISAAPQNTIEARMLGALAVNDVISANADEGVVLKLFKSDSSDSGKNVIEVGQAFEFAVTSAGSYGVIIELPPGVTDGGVQLTVRGASESRTVQAAGTAAITPALAEQICKWNESIAEGQPRVLISTRAQAIADDVLSPGMTLTEMITVVSEALSATSEISFGSDSFRNFDDATLNLDNLKLSPNVFLTNAEGRLVEFYIEGGELYTSEVTVYQYDSSGNCTASPG
jgi:hypothetical protein